MKRIVFASNNAHKLSEIKAMLHGQFQLVSLAEIGFVGDLPETGSTIEANAIQKAKTAYSVLRVPVFADDSGLEIYSLKGKPGIDSAHYSGSRDAHENMNLVLAELSDLLDRTARFVTIIAYVDSEGTHVFEGEVIGEIGKEKVGENGFGYDPIFYPRGESRTFAQMTGAEKSAISHRAKALKKFISFLNSN